MGEPTWAQLGDGDWSRLAAVAALGKRLYAVDSGSLWSIDPATGASERLGEDVWATRLLTAAHGRLYSIEGNGALFAIEPDGSYQALPGDWSGVTAGAGLPDLLVLAERDGALYAVNADGEYQSMRDDTWHMTWMAAVGNAFCALDKTTLYRVARDGTYKELSGDWTQAVAGAGCGASLYVSVKNGYLWRVNPDTGASASLPFDTMWNTRALVSLGPKLYAFEQSGGLYAITP